MKSHVLIADDEPAVRGSFARALELSGHQVTQAASGAEVIACLQKQAVDLLILDLSTPGTGQADLLGQVRSFAPTVKLLIVTGLATPATIQMALRAEAAGYLLKPIRLKELVETVQRILAQRSTRPDPSREALQQMKDLLVALQDNGDVTI